MNDTILATQRNDVELAGLLYKIQSTRALHVVIDNVVLYINMS